MGGRTALIEVAKNAFEGLVSVIKPVTEGFREIFPPMTAEKLFNITNALKEFTSHLKLSDSASANLKSTFKGIFAILDIGTFYKLDNTLNRFIKEVVFLDYFIKIDKPIAKTTSDF